MVSGLIKLQKVFLDTRRLSNRVTIYREIKVRGGTILEGYTTSFDAENDFVLNSHILGELREKLRSKMRLKIASTHREATYREMQRHEEQIQSLLKNLKTYVNRFHKAARNMV